MVTGIDIYAIMATPAWLGEIKTALTARRMLLQGINRATVVARNACLNREEDLEARRLEESMAENDACIEIDDEILKYIEESL